MEDQQLRPMANRVPWKWNDHKVNRNCRECSNEWVESGDLYDNHQGGSVGWRECLDPGDIHGDLRNDE